MAYKGKREQKRFRWNADHEATFILILAWLSFMVSLSVLLYTLASAKEPEPQPEPRTTTTQQVDEPAATEYAVWTEPVPEIVTLEGVTVTHYCGCGKCCGKWADGITATVVFEAKE